jgi:hypothetical protein
MAIPRPYGVGPYGAGPYSVYRGTLYEVGGAASITFSLAPRIDRVATLRCASSIAFSIQGELFVSWAAPGPCEAGAWTPADPCETGAWTPAPPAAAWGSARA